MSTTIYVVDDSAAAQVKARKAGEPVFAIIFGTLMTVGPRGECRNIIGDEWDRIVVDVTEGTARLVRA